jgi:flagellar motor switch protein FliN/FliY
MNDASGQLPDLGIALDLPLKLSAELPSTVKLTEEVLRLTTGSVVTLDKMTGGPVCLYANRKLIARGDAVVTGGNLGIKVTELNTPPVPSEEEN